MLKLCLRRSSPLARAANCSPAGTTENIPMNGNRLPRPPVISYKRVNCVILAHFYPFIRGYPNSEPLKVEKQVFQPKTQRISGSLGEGGEGASEDFVHNRAETEPHCETNIEAHGPPGLN